MCELHPFTIHFTTIATCTGPGRDPGDCEDWSLGRRLLHLHQLCKQTQLLCGRRDCHYCTLRQVRIQSD